MFKKLDLKLQQRIRDLQNSPTRLGKKMKTLRSENKIFEIINLAYKFRNRFEISDRRLKATKIDQKENSNSNIKK